MCGHMQPMLTLSNLDSGCYNHGHRMRNSPIPGLPVWVRDLVNSGSTSHILPDHTIYIYNNIVLHNKRCINYMQYDTHKEKTSFRNIYYAKQSKSYLKFLQFSHTNVVISVFFGQKANCLVRTCIITNFLLCSTNI